MCEREIVELSMAEDRGYDWSCCPSVKVVPGRMSGVPVVVGTRVPVQTITDNYDGGVDPLEIAEQWRLGIADVNAILEYREKLHARAAG